MAKIELKGIKFEEALKKLEKIVEHLETGDTPLEESLSLYEDGISLFKHCSAKLEEAKSKVEILTQKGESGKMEAQPFNTEKLEKTVKNGSEKSDKCDELPF